MVITAMVLSFTQKDTSAAIQGDSVTDSYALVKSAVDSTKPKDYPVAFPITKWDGYYQGIGFAISELRKSDRPSGSTNFIVDSVLFPLQQQILLQLQRQLQAEEAAKKKPPSGKN